MARVSCQMAYEMASMWEVVQLQVLSVESTYI